MKPKGADDTAKLSAELIDELLREELGRARKAADNSLKQRPDYLQNTLRKCAVQTLDFKKPLRLSGRLAFAATGVLVILVLFASNLGNGFYGSPADNYELAMTESAVLFDAQESSLYFYGESLDIQSVSLYFSTSEFWEGEDEQEAFDILFDT